MTEFKRIAVQPNRCIKHLALNDVPMFRRRMQRVQIAGSPVTFRGPVS